MSDWREQLKRQTTQLGIPPKAQEQVLEILKYNPNITRKGILVGLRDRGNKRLTLKGLRKFLVNSPKIHSVTKGKDTVYRLRE